jgi:hypothetical protein
MTGLSRGDVVLVWFPNSDLKTSRREFELRFFLEFAKSKPMGRILVVIPRGDFASDGRIPLVAQVRKVSSQLILLLLRHFRQRGLYFYQAHCQTMAFYGDDASPARSQNRTISRFRDANSQVS